MATIVGTRSPLFYKKVAGGLPVILDTSKYTGNVFYVDSAVGNDSTGYGSEPGKPFDSIDYAIGKCTANQGDVILVLPGHAETINTAGAITADNAGISIIGLGNGEDRPTITVGSSLDTSTVLVSAADVVLKNLIFQPGNDGVDVLLDVNADGCVVDSCEFRSDETNAYQADTYVDINGGGANAADRCVIRNCRFTSPTAGANQAIEIGAVEDAVRIEDNWIDGDWANAGIHSAAIFTNALIARNYIANRQAGDHAIEFTDACTGLLVDNRMYGSTLGTILDPGSLMCLGNLETDAIDQAGVDSPRVSAGGFPDDSITAAVIATGAIDADAIADNAIDAGAIAANAITAAKVADGTIDAATFAAGAINAAAIADAAIDAATFAAGAIDAAAIAAGAIDAATFAAGAIDAAAIAVGAIAADAFAAGAIDAAAIAVGAIAADAFAAGAIDAAAIAVGAIAADAFAAGAIDAAAIAAGAIDAATFAAGAIDATAIADNAIDAATLAADCITNAKVADNTLATEQFALSAAEKTCDGVVVTRATAALPQTAAVAIFTVTGHVLLKRILGVVTVQIGAVGNVTHLQSNSTGAGATTDICLAIAGLDVTGDVIDTMYEITGTVGDAMVATTNLAKAKSQVTELVIPPGTIEVECAGSDGGAGRVRWSAMYVPMESGAQIVAA